jgi:hypothetical protein
MEQGYKVITVLFDVWGIATIVNSEYQKVLAPY